MVTSAALMPLPTSDAALAERERPAGPLDPLCDHWLL